MLEIALKTVFILLVVVVGFAPVITWVRRKQGASLPDRLGSGRADGAGVIFSGALHPLADMLKLLAKESFVPVGSNRFLHALAPIIAAVPPVMAFAVIPFGGVYHFAEGTVSLVVADIDWGILYVLALGSLATYGPMLAGWSSNGDGSILAAVRNAAQRISCQVPLGLSLVGLFMVFGTLKLTDMAVAQDTTFRFFAFLEVLPPIPVPGWLLETFGGVRLPRWGVFLQPLAFVMFLACIMAANRRPPFDLPEGDTEIAAGPLTEYSGMRFGLFYLSEFIEVVVIAGLCTALFLGGWSIPYLPQQTIIAGLATLLGSDLATLVCLLLHVACFFAKVCAMIWLQVRVRRSFRGFRDEPWMDLCWKVILPLCFVNIFVTALLMLLVGGLVT